MKRIPLYLILVAIYPVLSLFALNINEANILDTYRPLLISLLSLSIATWIVNLFCKNVQKAALINAVGFLIFFSYGAIYNVVEDFQIAGFLVGRHRYLIPVVLVVFLLISRSITRIKPGMLGSFTQATNLFAIVLIAFPAFTLITKGSQIHWPAKAIENVPVQQVSGDQNLPDVYYFVLDSYPRADYIHKYMGYDNSGFIEFLKDHDFYVVDCGLSNYSYTRLSLSTTLNMEYMENLSGKFTPDNTDESMLNSFIFENKVMAEFKAHGYKTIAFATGYGFTEIQDADYYFQPELQPITQPVMTEFELMVLNNTVLSTITHDEKFATMAGLNFPYYKRWHLQHFIIDTLKKVPQIQGPKFVFVHLVTTHRPYIYDSDGGMLMDMKYYKNDGVPVNEEAYIEGFKRGLEFTNSYMKELIEMIQSDSRIPPVIIVQGDHGVREPGRISILNAISIPGSNFEFYPSMTPVNTYRVVINQVLGEELPLLPDKSYYANVNLAPYDLMPANNASSCEIQ